MSSAEGMDLLDQAQELQRHCKFEEAEAIYDRLIQQNHSHPVLMAQMGTLYLQTERIGLAIHLLEVAARDMPNGEVLCNLAIAYRQSGQHKKCKELFARSMKVNPTAESIANYAALFCNVGEPEKAVELSARALKEDPNCPTAHWHTAIAKLELGQFEEGWKHWEWGFKCTPNMRIDRHERRAPKWDGTPGQRVLVYGEQGLGDEIMFASMLPDMMRQNTVVLESHKRLKHLFEHSFPGLKVYGTREDEQIPWILDEKFDAQISIGSLGQFFRNQRADFPGTPYLSAQPAKRGDKFRVGISWTGGMKQGRVRTRSVPLPWWDCILNNDAEFISLQYTDCDEEIQRMKDAGYPIKQYDAIQAKDYYETARLVASCDLVISCCTSVIHLAGALGVPCWVMTPHKAAWRYGVRGPMPWYRSVRLYRQPIDEAWKPVIARVGFDLSQLLKEREQCKNKNSFIPGETRPEITEDTFFGGSAQLQ